MMEENIIPFNIKAQNKKGFVNLNGCIKEDTDDRGNMQRVYINCYFAKEIQKFDVLDQLYALETQNQAV